MSCISPPAPTAIFYSHGCTVPLRCSLLPPRGHRGLGFLAWVSES